MCLVRLQGRSVCEIPQPSSVRDSLCSTANRFCACEILRKPYEKVSNNASRHSINKHKLKSFGSSGMHQSINLLWPSFAILFYPFCRNTNQILMLHLSLSQPLLRAAFCFFALRGPRTTKPHAALEFISRHAVGAGGITMRRGQRKTGGAGLG
eukprot:3762254-Rhodomonas_salina.5